MYNVRFTMYDVGCAATAPTLHHFLSTPTEDTENSRGISQNRGKEEKRIKSQSQVLLSISSIFQKLYPQGVKMEGARIQCTMYDLRCMM